MTLTFLRWCDSVQRRLVISDATSGDGQPTVFGSDFGCTCAAESTARVCVAQLQQREREILRIAFMIGKTVALHAFDGGDAVADDDRQAGGGGVQHAGGFLLRPNTDIGGTI